MISEAKINACGVKHLRNSLILRDCIREMTFNRRCIYVECLYFVCCVKHLSMATKLMEYGEWCRIPRTRPRLIICIYYFICVLRCLFGEPHSHTHYRSVYVGFGGTRDHFIKNECVFFLLFASVN